MIEARDLDEAIEIASKHPSARMREGERFNWRIELRPFGDFDPD